MRNRTEPGGLTGRRPKTLQLAKQGSTNPLVSQETQENWNKLLDHCAVHLF